MANLIEEPAPTLRTAPQSARWRHGWLLVVVGIALAAAAWPLWRHVKAGDAFYAARDFLRQSQPEQAIDCLRTLAERLPDSAEVEFLLGSAKRRAGRLAEVEPHLARAERLGWDPRAIHRQRFLAIFQSGDYRRAGPFVKQLMAEGGSDDEAAEVYEAMIRGYFSAMLLREARFLIDSWCQWQPSNSRPHLLRAESAVLVGDLQAEIAAYREYLSIVPNDYPMRQLLAEALLNFHKFDEALEILRQCDTERPGDAPNLIGLGECLLRKGELEAAQENLDAANRAQLSDGQRVTVLTLLTKLAIAKGEHQQAVELLRKAIKLSPSDMPSLYAIGQSLERVGQSNEAKKYLDRWRVLKRISDRVQELREELLRNPDSADLRCEMGTLLLKKDPLDVNGLNWLLSSLMRNPAHQEAHVALAGYYKSVGDLEAAQRHRAAAERLQALEQRQQQGTDGEAGEKADAAPEAAEADIEVTNG